MVDFGTTSKFENVVFHDVARKEQGDTVVSNTWYLWFVGNAIYGQQVTHDHDTHKIHITQKSQLLCKNIIRQSSMQILIHGWIEME